MIRYERDKGMKEIFSEPLLKIIAENGDGSLSVSYCPIFAEKTEIGPKLLTSKSGFIVIKLSDIKST